jgi:hypothetical protein
MDLNYVGRYTFVHRISQSKSIFMYVNYLAAPSVACVRMLITMAIEYETGK